MFHDQNLQIDLISEFVLSFELTLIQCNFVYLQIFEKVLLDLYCVTPLYEILFDKTVHLKPYLNHDFLILQLSHQFDQYSKHHRLLKFHLLYQ